MSLSIAPPTEEQLARNAKLEELLKKSMEAFEKLPIIDQVLHRIEQRQSWVRGEMGIEHPEMDPTYINRLVHESDYAAILAEEVKRLRKELALLTGEKQ